ncbi:MULTISPECIES: flavin-containing monooxygenase [unclassified Streptomyces]|uniref:flavin-containing monooxygenase n=1 Tax=unclassified Streptomyces TaxID=2593676 RepID=UPI0022B73877|nr:MULTISPECIES: NAD(P)/FAD-dependent oxidoreductase [unclassified Streptomyces]MCZ7414755.1 NAD(P)/FAD-dependent oxidoreductase [Streptomyces sp. WMMC897]MCZ7431678.1 NAD(P)/FAD-dependent oxidoreductase [Streptomyces sp. WMMC1477]
MLRQDPDRLSPPPSEHVDVLVVGAGLSGIGTACRLSRDSPGRSFAVLESREAVGGTWDLFRYPGVRSDSDMFTLGYAFRPWRGDRAIAEGAAIRDYIRDTARAFGVDRHIRFGHRVLRADWSSREARWTVTARRLDTGEETRITCSFLAACAGYYRYDAGHTPHFPGADRFRGPVVHPQHWPEDLDWRGRRVVVIGSGATAVTLVPALAESAAHVTMLQRSPSYVAAMSAADPLARLLRPLPERVRHVAVRWKNVLVSQAGYQLSRRRPRLMKALLRRGVRNWLPDGFDVETHFTPRYEPWDQRLCATPDGDLFRALRRGDASVVTDRVTAFTETGIALASGAHLDADVIVTATGLTLQPIGGIRLGVDGEEVELGRTLAYKGAMLSGVPNFTLTLGYTNASWTLKADLVARYVCRLLDHLEKTGHAAAVPVAPALPPGEKPGPLIDLRSGYVLRGVDALPRQGARAPWRLHQNYLRDLRLLGRSRVDDGHLRFTTAASEAATSPAEAHG